MGETSTSAPLAFLGAGVLRPFQRDQKNDFAKGSGARLFEARVGQILGTKASTPAAPGEVPWRTDFGARLHLLRHLNDNEVLEDTAHAYIVDALSRWEPSIVVGTVRVDRDSIPKTVILIVRFSIVDQTGQTTLENLEARVPLGDAA